MFGEHRVVFGLQTYNPGRTRGKLMIDAHNIRRRSENDDGDTSDAA